MPKWPDCTPTASETPQQLVGRRACCCESPLSQTVRPRMSFSRSQGVNVSSDVLFWPSHSACSSLCAAQLALL